MNSEVDTNVSEKHTASIFRSEKEHNIWFFINLCNICNIIAKNGIINNIIFAIILQFSSEVSIFFFRPDDGGSMFLRSLLFSRCQ
jgi:hypothetical protein